MSRKNPTRRILFTNDDPARMFEMVGFMLTEHAKRVLRANGTKNERNTWAEVFPNHDVVYRYNALKGKSDVYIGTLNKVRYASRAVYEPVKSEASIYADPVLDLPPWAQLCLDVFTISGQNVTRLPMDETLAR